MASKKRALIKEHEYLVEILGRRFPVRNMEHASRLVSAVRDRSGAGASEMGSKFRIYEDGVEVGHVSYNGRVWEGVHGDARLVYDP